VAGEYALTLTVRDDLGGTGTAAWSVRVNPAPALGIATSLSVVDVNHSVTLTAAISGGTGSGPTNWTFGDGTAATGTVVTHSWTRAGTYVINASYQDGNGMVATSSQSLLVDPALTGSFSAAAPSSATPVPGTELTFTATLSGGAAPFKVLWSFGDGSTATGAQVTHAYAASGTYSVNATVTDHTGAVLNGSLPLSISTAPSGASSSSGSSLTFPLGLFLGVLVGAALAAVVVYAVGPRRRKEQPPPPPAAVAPSPYVTPGAAEWKED